MELWLFNMPYEAMCKYIFKKNMDKEIEKERRKYIDITTNERIAENLIYENYSLEDIIKGINKFKQDCANTFEIGEVIQFCKTGEFGIIIEIPKDDFDKYKVLEYINNYNHNFKFETRECKAFELTKAKQRKICKDIKKIVEMGAITDD